MANDNNTSAGTLLEIQMLGGLFMKRGNRTLSDDSGRTKQVWNFLEYILANRNNDISQDKLIDILWPYDDCDNPANALKNLAYRLRNTLSRLDIPDERNDYISLKRGVYSWNNDIDCKLDIEELELLYRQASDESLADVVRIELYEQAIMLYKGDFLPKSAFEEWVVPLSEYYRRVYMNCVYSIVALLTKASMFEKIIAICNRSIAIDPFEEYVHEHLIRALVATGNQQKALEHYDYVNNLFYKELGLQTSDAIRGLYKEISKNLNSVELDICAITSDLREEERAQHAFLCNYEVFRNLYRLEARAAARNGTSIYIALLTVVGKNNTVPEVPLLTIAMDTLQEAVVSSLRIGDVVARFSSTQFVLMLSSLTFESGEKVLERIENKFNKIYKSRPVTIHKLLYPLEPVL